MKAKTEELLYLLLWWSDLATRPTFRNLTNSFEAWAYRNGLHGQLASLERRKLLEQINPHERGGLAHLTDLGRTRALGGRDPEERWNRPWDGSWRMVVFDLPQSRNNERVRLRRFLRAHGFGYLQNSVWVSPDPISTAAPELSKVGQDVESFLTLEARPCSGESDDSIVNGAWDFAQINERYRRYIEVLEAIPTSAAGGESSHKKLQNWIQQERLAWLEAVSQDPLLPTALLPDGYLGQQAWQRRGRVLKGGRRVKP